MQGRDGRVARPGAARRRTAVVLLGCLALGLMSVLGERPSRATVTGGTLAVVAGDGTGSSVVPGPAASSPVSNPNDVAVDTAGNVFVSLSDHGYLAKITPSGTISVIAGTGANADPVPGPAVSSPLNEPTSLATDAAGNLYVCDVVAGEVVRITPSGTLSVVAGDGNSGTPVPGPATATHITAPSSVVVDAAGTMYVADFDNNLIDRISAGGTLTVYAGDGGTGVSAAGPALSRHIEGPSGLVLDPAGNLYALNYNSQIVRITPAGALSIVAGTGNYGPPTPGPALSSDMTFSQDLEMDNAGNLYVTGTADSRLYRISPAGTLAVFAGDGSAAAPTPGPALSSPLNNPYGLAMDHRSGRLYVADMFNRMVESITLQDAPLAPTAATTLAATGTTARVRFTVPAFDGNSPITGYQVNTGTGWVTVTASGSGATRTLDLTGLAVGRTYRVRLRAVNAVGAGPASTQTTVHTAADTPPLVLPPSARKGLVPIPRHPRSYRGPLVKTRAFARSRHDIDAFAIPTLNSYQMHPGQAAQLSNDALFRYDRAELTARGRAEILILSRSLLGAHHIVCEGYTDYAGDRRHEATLSSQRARAVCRQLHLDGVDAARTSAGYGGTRPAVIGGLPGRRAANRRVVVTVLT